MSQIDIINLSFSYDGSSDEIFKNVSFRIDTDWKLGFIGRNGRGKTTFLNLLLGKYEYSGTISSNVIFEYFPCEIKDKSRLTEDIITEISGDEDGTILWKIYKELSLLDVEEDVLYRPFNTLSNGEQTKVLLAGMFIRDDAFLLIDEPTNHLDMKTRALVSDYLKKKKGFILVSHDRAFLDGCIDHVLSINKVNIEVQKGNYSSWKLNKDNSDSFAMERDEKLKSDISRLQTASARISGWSDKLEATKYHSNNSGLDIDRGYVGAKSAKLMARVKSQQKRAENAINERKGLLSNIEENEKLKIKCEEFHSKRLLYVRELSIDYGNGELFSPVTFELLSHDRIALSGKNGCGKTSILKLIMGMDIPHSGEIKTASQLKISYVAQDSSHLSGNLKDYAEDNGLDRSLFQTILRKMDFERIQFDKDMKDFSAGQKKKVLLAASLSKPANLYVWDEPLNYIDVLSRLQIEELIESSDASMIFIEHDRAFTEKIATKTINLN